MSCSTSGRDTGVFMYRAYRNVAYMSLLLIRTLSAPLDPAERQTGAGGGPEDRRTGRGPGLSGRSSRKAASSCGRCPGQRAASVYIYIFHFDRQWLRNAHVNIRFLLRRQRAGAWRFFETVPGRVTRNLILITEVKFHSLNVGYWSKVIEKAHVCEKSKKQKVPKFKGLNEAVKSSCSVFLH